MIRINVLNAAFNRAYWRAYNSMPVWESETPRHYGQRWREAFKCRVDSSSPVNDVYYIFDCDEDYTWFMLKWG